jgi:drug/metabolite transporter (DMT)-like permease
MKKKTTNSNFFGKLSAHSSIFELKFYQILLFIAGFLFGLIPVVATILSRLGYTAIEQTVARLTFAGFFSILIIIGLFLYRTEFKKELRNYTDWKLVLVQGFLLVLMFYAYVGAIVLGIPAGEAALLVQIQPLVTIFLSFLIFKEKISLKHFISLFSAFLGIFLLIEPWKWDSIGVTLIGDFLAALNGFLYSIYIVLGKYRLHNRETPKDTIDYKYASFLLTLVAASIIDLILIIPIQFLISPSDPLFDILMLRIDVFFHLEFLFFSLFITISSTIITYAFLSLASNKVSGAQTAILLLMEPVSAVILGILILSQALSPNFIFGGFFICLAIVIVSKKSYHNS